MTQVYFKGTPCNEKRIEENDRLVWRPTVAAIRTAIMRTVVAYTTPITIVLPFGPTDQQAIENMEKAAEISERTLVRDEWCYRFVEKQ